MNLNYDTTTNDKLLINQPISAYHTLVRNLSRTPIIGGVINAETQKWNPLYGGINKLSSSSCFELALALGTDRPGCRLDG